MVSGESQIAAPDPRLVAAFHSAKPGIALDLACGSGRHALWLSSLGWQVTGVDIREARMTGFHFIQADLEQHGFEIAPSAWNLIVCWLYWQADLLAPIERGVAPGGSVALAGKTTGRFATALERYREAFPGWRERDSGAGAGFTWFIAEKPIAERVTTNPANAPP